MNDELLKQIVFDCAVELIHCHEQLTREEVGDTLLRAISLHDKSNGEAD